MWFALLMQHANPGIESRPVLAVDLRCVCVFCVCMVFFLPCHCHCICRFFLSRMAPCPVGSQLKESRHSHAAPRRTSPRHNATHREHSMEEPDSATAPTVGDGTGAEASVVYPTLPPTYPYRLPTRHSAPAPHALVPPVGRGGGSRLTAFYLPKWSWPIGRRGHTGQARHRQSLRELLGAGVV